MLRQFISDKLHQNTEINLTRVLILVLGFLNNLNVAFSTSQTHESLSLF